MKKRTDLCPIRAETSCVGASALVSLLMLVATAPAAAHVKWFSRDADCAMPPLSPLQVVSSADFMLIGAISMALMMFAASLDAYLSRAGSVAFALAERVDDRMSGGVPRLLRLALATFLCVAVLYYGAQPVYLTPELRATGAWVPALQLAIAATLLRRSSAWLGALGIVVLYACAIQSYGWFHLLDYPVFLGIAAFIAIDSLGRGRHGDTALAVLRASAAVMLMWGGAEKWLYPWWSFDILDHQLLAARGGVSSGFFMAAAGWGEFCVAYALMFGRLGSQIAAWVLLVPFVAAIPVFGALDAVGHAPIIIVLVILGLTRSRLPAAVQGVANRRAALGRGVSCTFAALALVGVYWGLRTLAYGDDNATSMSVVAVLLTAPLVLWWLPRLQPRAGAAPAPHRDAMPAAS